MKCYKSDMTLEGSTRISLTVPPDVAKLFAALGDTHLRYVGGCVRNALLGVPIGDIDLATTHTPDIVIKKLAAAKIKTVPTGIDYGTVTAVLNGVGYEITTLRRDVETDGRRAVVAYTNDWAEDAARRDFTINALYANSDGVVYDPLGSGLHDIERRRVIFVGDADTRIQEDYLRILRFFRFHAVYGRGAVDKVALASCARYAPKIKTLSRERVTQEFTKILMGASPQKILQLMTDHKILPSVLGKNFDGNKFATLLKLTKNIGAVDPDIIFAARLITVMGGSHKIPDTLIFTKKQIGIFESSTKIKLTDVTTITPLQMMELVYLHSLPSLFVAVVLACLAEQVTPARFSKLWALLHSTKRPQLPVTGRDLIAAGYSEGVEMGKYLKSLEKKWIASGFKLSRPELLGL